MSDEEEFFSPSNPKFSKRVVINLSHPTDRGFRNPATGEVDIWVDADMNKLTLLIKDNKALADNIANAYKEKFDAEIMPDNDTYQFQLNALYKALNAPNMDNNTRQAILDVLSTTNDQPSPNLLTDQKLLQEFINRKPTGSVTPAQNFLNSFQSQLADDHPLKNYELPHYTSVNKDQDRIVMTLKSADRSLKWHDHVLGEEECIETSKRAKQLDTIIQQIQTDFFPTHEAVHARTKAYGRE